MSQQKQISGGRVALWEVDVTALAAVAPWVRGRPDRLDSELKELSEHFPTWLVTLGQHHPSEGWPWASALFCPACGEMIVPDDGLRCVGCRRHLSSEQALVGFAGRLPALATGRPVLTALRERARRERERGDPRAAARMEAYVLAVGSERYFAPPVWVFCPSNFPQGEPFVMVRPEYFDVLGIPADHIYPGPRWRLCNYAHWHAVSVRTVLQQRIVPRIYLDLMVADLVALDALSDVLRTLELSLHSLYNAAGHGESSARLADLYAEALQRA